jgi:predicted nucleic acid-binding protein
MRLLFDSSSIYKMAEVGKIVPFVGSFTCSLARYELGNILVTNVRIKKDVDTHQQKELLGFLLKVVGLMRVININGDEEPVLELSIKYGLSFYDASFAYAAKKMSAVLVTEDRKLSQKINGYVDTTTVSNLS